MYATATTPSGQESRGCDATGLPARSKGNEEVKQFYADSMCGANRFKEGSLGRVSLHLQWSGVAFHPVYQTPFSSNMNMASISAAYGRLARLPRIGLIYDFGHNNFSVGSVMQERKQFVVTCKDCHRAVPTGAKEFQFHSTEVTCPLCGEKHRYLPSEVILDRPNELAAKKQRA
jgi:hypothetical protein